MVGEASEMLLSTLTVSEQRGWQPAPGWAGDGGGGGPSSLPPPAPGVRSPAVP